MQRRIPANIKAIFTTLTLSFLIVPAPSFAQMDKVIEASRRINIAGRQRMLSQRMSMAACFIQNDVNVDEHVAKLRDAFVLFSSSHNALRYGDKRDGLGPETITPALEAMSEVNQQWGIVANYLETGLNSGEINLADLIQIDRNGLVLLKEMNTAVHKIATGYGEILPDLPLLHSITIDIAGRQRMLSQKATKELCLIDAGIDADVNREKLGKTIGLFSNVLDALIAGQQGIVIAPPNKAVLTKLEQVKLAWEQPSAIFAKVAAGEDISSEQRLVIIAQMEVVLKAMNQAVGMYEFSKHN